MIHFQEAETLIAARTPTAQKIRVPLNHALGAIAAEDIASAIDLPPFANSAVDGYACASEVWNKHGRLAISENIARAQAQIMIAHEPTTAMKIMTGAPIPEGADSVVMQEHVQIVDGMAQIDKRVKAGDNIRAQGEDCLRGTKIVTAGTRINAQMIGLLAGVGLAEVTIFKPPTVYIISTGDELKLPGQPLSLGEVYYLMGPMLEAQCAQIGVHDVRFEMVADDHNQILAAISRAEHADVVLLTGGMSKGDYDHVRSALAASNVEEIFYQGYWRPGKPLYFGKRGAQIIFGLPGNPVAAFVCFHIFVRRALFQSMKAKHLATTRRAIALNDFEKKPGFTFFARAIVNDDNLLEFVAGQGSHQIFSLSFANALALLPMDKAIVKAGEVVHYYPC